MDDFNCEEKQDVFVKNGCSRWQQSQYLAKSLISFAPALPPGACGGIE